MHKNPDRAFILAAGKGTRLKPWTDTMPKPMVPVGGVPIIGHTLQKLEKAGVSDVMINLHHLPDVLEDYLQKIQRPSIHYSHEDVLLETGGGTQKVLPFFEDRPFYMINGDALWSEKGVPALDRLGDAFDADTMDILLLLQPVGQMTLTGGVGDYDLLPDGRAVRRTDKGGTHMFAGVRITVPSIFDRQVGVPYSFLELMDRAQDAGRLHGLVHDGHWHHISTPEDLDRVNAAIIDGTYGENGRG
jgi:MurNAc alpha-1-phosphate uridylyltransferase